MVTDNYMFKFPCDNVLPYAYSGQYISYIYVWLYYDYVCFINTSSGASLFGNACMCMIPNIWSSWSLWEGPVGAPQDTSNEIPMISYDFLTMGSTHIRSSQPFASTRWLRCFLPIIPLGDAVLALARIPFNRRFCFVSTCSPVSTDIRSLGQIIPSRIRICGWGIWRYY